MTETKFRSLIATAPRQREVIRFTFTDKAEGRELTWSVDTFTPRPGWQLDGWGRPDTVAELLADGLGLVNGWTEAEVARLLEIGHRYHLNGLNAGCEHQRAEGWDKRPIDPSKPTNAYGRHFEGQQGDSWNMLGWVRPDEHPDGLLTKPCPVCGYGYGTAWKHEQLPADIEAEVAAIMAAHPEPFEVLTEATT
jgi:class 3 adenylate cyclase